MSRRAAKPLPSKEDTTLTRDGVVVAALTLIDEQGLDAFSTRKLGARVGLRAMSLYHYFPSREALLDAAVDRMIAEVTLPNVKKVGWRRGLQRLAQSYRAMGHRHLLAIPLLAQRCPSSPTMQRFLDTLHGLLLKVGLSPETAADWLFIQRDYVIGSLMADFSSHILAREMITSADVSASRNHTVQGITLPSKAREQAFKKGFNAMLDAVEREH
jgi:AcrR family transcriptional regulator